MPLLLPKNLPRYECLLEAAKAFPDLDPSACEAFLHLLRAGDVAFQMGEDYFAGHNMTPGRFSVLMLLLQKTKDCPQPSTPAELAELCGVTRATMTGLVDTLERDGLVRREADTHDRRMMTVHLTPKGHAQMAAILPGHFKRIAAVMQPLSAQERRTLTDLLGKIIRHSTGYGDLAASLPGPEAHAHI
jgi:DNA-binding MarR family transcriptional regulator